MLDDLWDITGGATATDVSFTVGLDLLDWLVKEFIHQYSYNRDNRSLDNHIYLKYRWRLAESITWCNVM